MKGTKRLSPLIERPEWGGVDDGVPYDEWLSTLDIEREGKEILILQYQALAKSGRDIFTEELIHRG